MKGMVRGIATSQQQQQNNNNNKNMSHYIDREGMSNAMKILNYRLITLECDKFVTDGHFPNFERLKAYTKNKW